MTKFIITSNTSGGGDITLTLESDGQQLTQNLGSQSFLAEVNGFIGLTDVMTSLLGQNYPVAEKLMTSLQSAEEPFKRANPQQHRAFDQIKQRAISAAANFRRALEAHMSISQHAATIADLQRQLNASVAQQKAADQLRDTERARAADTERELRGQIDMLLERRPPHALASHAFAPSHETEDLRRETEGLRRENEKLRREYETCRHETAAVVEVFDQEAQFVHWQPRGGTDLRSMSVDKLNEELTYDIWTVYGDKLHYVGNTTRRDGRWAHTITGEAHTGTVVLAPQNIFRERTKYPHVDLRSKYLELLQRERDKTHAPSAGCTTQANICTVEEELNRLRERKDPAQARCLVASLYETDLLREMMRSRGMFAGFREEPINFLPSSRFVTADDGWTAQYNLLKQARNDLVADRLPGYPDRILYSGLEAIAQTYRLVDDVHSSSDHRPVALQLRLGDDEDERALVVTYNCNNRYDAPLFERISGMGVNLGLTILHLQEVGDGLFRLINDQLAPKGFKGQMKCAGAFGYGLASFYKAGKAGSSAFAVNFGLCVPAQRVSEGGLRKLERWAKSTVTGELQTKGFVPNRVELGKHHLLCYNVHAPFLDETTLLRFYRQLQVHNRRGGEVVVIIAGDLNSRSKVLGPRGPIPFAKTISVRDAECDATLAV
jgi:hypothetical protein